MKVQIELFGASRDFSNQNSLHFDLDQNSTIKDVRKKLIDYLDNNKIVISSAFCSEDNNIVSDNYKITKNEKIAIIPPIGGG
jgi:molybdopterin converting factor small subunit